MTKIPNTKRLPIDPELTTEGLTDEGLTTYKLTAEGLVTGSDVLVIESWNLLVIGCLYFGVFYADVGCSRWLSANSSSRHANTPSL